MTTDNYKRPINKWAEADRPREKLMNKGASVLSNSELMAILIGSGNKDESAVDLCRRMLASVDNDLYRLGKLSITQITKEFKGIGTAKAITILAALELSRRVNPPAKLDKMQITSSRKAYEAFYPLMGDLPHEEVWALLLDRSNKVIAPMQVSKGGISQSVVDVRLVLREAITSYASALILGHNHPSGTLSPSAADEHITDKLNKAAQLMDIRLLDHIIVCGEQYYSFADMGKLI